MKNLNSELNFVTKKSNIDGKKPYLDDIKNFITEIIDEKTLNDNEKITTIVANNELLKDFRKKNIINFPITCILVNEIMNNITMIDSEEKSEILLIQNIRLKNDDKAEDDEDAEKPKAIKNLYNMDTKNWFVKF